MHRLQHAECLIREIDLEMHSLGINRVILLRLTPLEVVLRSTMCQVGERGTHSRCLTRFGSDYPRR
jgi:hypothetical protein